ncbi:MAG: DNA gyrase inhibitor YacG [Alphaproteobacteria bacterium]
MATKCPTCGSGTVHDFRPFCSKRCADLDLGNWLDGKYAIAGEPVSADIVDLEAVRKAAEEES